MNIDSKIYVAGHNGMVGSALVRKLKELGYTNIITASKKELNLLNQLSVQSFFSNELPEYVFLCAAKVGGIKANNEMKGNQLIEYIKEVDNDDNLYYQILKEPHFNNPKSKDLEYKSFIDFFEKIILEI